MDDTLSMLVEEYENENFEQSDSSLVKSDFTDILCSVESNQTGNYASSVSKEVVTVNPIFNIESDVVQKLIKSDFTFNELNQSNEKKLAISTTVALNTTSSLSSITPSHHHQQQQQKRNNRGHIDRYNGLTEDEVVQRKLPDYLREGLDLIVVGINPSMTSASVGHHYAGIGNHFWTCIQEAGIVNEHVTCFDDYRMVDLGIGFTNVCSRPTKGAAEISRKEMKAGAAIMLNKMRKYHPKIAVFNGKGIYEAFVGHKNFYMGRQPKPLDGTDIIIFVMPSSSARCAQLPRAEDKLPFFIALRKLRDFVKGQLSILHDHEVIFQDYTEFRVTQPDPKSLRKAERRRKRKAEQMLALTNATTTINPSTTDTNNNGTGAIGNKQQIGFELAVKPVLRKQTRLLNPNNHNNGVHNNSTTNNNNSTINGSVYFTNHKTITPKEPISHHNNSNNLHNNHTSSNHNQQQQQQQQHHFIQSSQNTNHTVQQIKEYTILAPLQQHHSSSNAVNTSSHTEYGAIAIATPGADGSTDLTLIDNASAAAYFSNAAQSLSTNNPSVGTATIVNSNSGGGNNSNNISSHHQTQQLEIPFAAILNQSNGVISLLPAELLINAGGQTAFTTADIFSANQSPKPIILQQDALGQTYMIAAPSIFQPQQTTTLLSWPPQQQNTTFAIIQQPQQLQQSQQVSQQQAPPSTTQDNSVSSSNNKSNTNNTSGTTTTTTTNSTTSVNSTTSMTPTDAATIVAQSQQQTHNIILNQQQQPQQQIICTAAALQQLLQQQQQQQQQQQFQIINPMSFAQPFTIQTTPIMQAVSSANCIQLQSTSPPPCNMVNSSSSSAPMSNSSASTTTVLSNTHQPHYYNISPSLQCSSPQHQHQQHHLSTSNCLISSAITHDLISSSTTVSSASSLHCPSGTISSQLHHQNHHTQHISLHHTDISSSSTPPNIHDVDDEDPDEDPDEHSSNHHHHHHIDIDEDDDLIQCSSTIDNSVVDKISFFNNDSSAPSVM